MSIDAPDARSFADLLWSSLNPDNKVALFVRYINLAGGAWESVIINKHQEV